ncbi:prostaglandin E synthase 2 isoform X1 [Tetranychus urticae]|uniref:Prostaglandin E synthase 2 n=1 Tax=Tetranychus urticae TaxID=32264 RepID=T1K2H0_TETUR|nr:prostaglandin E synthase 2 isoform X1 [Tetranychus urticae]
MLSRRFISFSRSVKFNVEYFRSPGEVLNCNKYVGVHQCFRKISADSTISSKPSKKKIFLVGGLTFCATYAAMEGVSQYWNKPGKFAGDHGKSNENHLEWDSYLRTVKNKPKGTVAGYVIPKEKLPSIPVSREVGGPYELNGVTFSLFQYQTCPFCCKVRSFMDYYGLPYNVVEVDPVLRQQLKFSKYRKVPIMLVDEKTKDGKDSSKYVQLTDSSLIISIIATYLMYNKEGESVQRIMDYYQNLDDSRNLETDVINKYFLMIGESWTPKKLKDNENRLHEERYWREWTDNYLVHVISPNVYRTLSESFDSFNYFSKVGQWDKYFPAWERYICIYIGAIGMYFVSKRLKKRHGLKEDVRTSLYDTCQLWVKAIGKNRKFMGGDKPNLADLAVFGALSSFEGCEAFRDLLKNVNIGPWYYSVKELCEAHAGAKLLTNPE